MTRFPRSVLPRMQQRLSTRLMQRQPGKRQRQALDLGVVKQQLSQRPRTQAAQCTPSALQVVALTNAARHHQRLALAAQQHFSDPHPLPGLQPQNVGLVSPHTREALAQTLHLHRTKRAPQVRRQRSTCMQPRTKRRMRGQLRACAGMPLQKIDRPVNVVKSSKAKEPACELPEGSSAGDHTHTAHSCGMTATMPPPTPLLAGNPTRKAKSPAAS
jgi:hypothetical protein